MVIIYDIFVTNNNLFKTIHPKKAFTLEFADHLWRQFLDQPQSYFVVSTIFNSQIYKIVVIEWKHGIGPNDIILR